MVSSTFLKKTKDYIPAEETWGFPHASVGKESACNARAAGGADLIPGSRRSPGRGNGKPLQYPCLEKSHRQRSLAGNGPWGHKESDMTDHTPQEET